MSSKLTFLALELFTPTVWGLYISYCLYVIQCLHTTLPTVFTFCQYCCFTCKKYYDILYPILLQYICFIAKINMWDFFLVLMAFYTKYLKYETNFELKVVFYWGTFIRRNTALYNKYNQNSLAYSQNVRSVRKFTNVIQTAIYNCDLYWNIWYAFT